MTYAPTWGFVFNMLANHRQDVHSDEQTLNRLWLAASGGGGPLISQATALLSYESWDRNRLAALNAHQPPPTKDPYNDTDPPIVVRWNGVDRRIDGQRRIHKWITEGKVTSHVVIVITP